MRAPRHYLLLLVVYLYSSSKEKRETHISLTNSLFFFLLPFFSLFIKSLSSALLSSLSVFLLTIFCEKNANSFSSLLQNLQKKFATQIEGQTKERKEKKRTFNGSIFSEKRLLSRNSLFKKNHHPNAGRVYTHTRAHTHTFVSLDL